MTKAKKRKRGFKKVSTPGSPPGALPQETLRSAKIDILAYSSDRVHSIAPANLSDLPEIESRHDVIWINITGTEDTKLLLELADRYGLHLLSLEDVMNVHQRAKFETFETYNFCVLRMVLSRTASEQLSIFHSGNSIITIQEQEANCLKPLRRRIENKAGQVRMRGSDYLLYAIVDSVLDHYFPVVDEIDSLLADLDEDLLTNVRSLPIDKVHGLRRDSIELRKWLRPHREMVGQMLRSGNNIQPETRVFMKDCDDHVTQLAEGIDHCLETCNILRDFHFNAVSNKTNEVMKTLTIISTIFIPLSFLAGVFGMNFQHLPGLSWRYGFATLSAFMLAIGGGMMAWFYRRGWFR